MDEKMEEAKEESKKVITDVVIRKVTNGFMVIDVTPKRGPEDKDGKVWVAETIDEALSLVKGIV